VLITYVQYIVWSFVKVKRASTQGAASLIPLKLDPFCWQAICWGPGWGRFCFVPEMFTTYFFPSFFHFRVSFKKIFCLFWKPKINHCNHKVPLRTLLQDLINVKVFGTISMAVGVVSCTQVFYLRVCSCIVTFLLSIRLWLLASMNSKRSERKLAWTNWSSLLPEIAWHERAERRKQNSKPLGNLSLYTFPIKTQRKLSILKI
jgi:hypothetical protein